MTRIWNLSVLIAAVAAVGLVAGCREDELNRTLQREKGAYQGPADTELTDEQRRELQRRGERQRF